MDAHYADPIAWVSEALARADIEDARLEAQLLLALALGTTRSRIVAGLFEPIEGDTRARVEGLVAARCAHTPLAYLRGTQEFYGLEFEVSPAVLIPRPETELLVDFAREVFGSRRTVPAGPRFADVGTGSGCIAMAILAHCPASRGIGIDISGDALQVARRNRSRHGLDDRLRFVHGDLMSGVVEASLMLIVSNPPYIPESHLAGLQPEVRQEPGVALKGGDLDGLAEYRRLAPQAARRLAPGGRIAVEVGQGQAPAVAEIFTRSGLAGIEVRRDLAGIERVVIGSR